MQPLPHSYLRFIRSASLAAVVFAAVTADPRSAAAQRATRDWRPEERVVLGDFSTITAVAAASDRVFVVSPRAVLVWRPDFRRWEGPFLPPDPRLLDQVSVALVDPLDNSLWLGGATRWIHYEPDLDAWSSGLAGDRVLSVAFDLDAPGNGLLLQTRSGWLQVARGGGAPMPASPPANPLRPESVSELVRRNPSMQALGSQYLLDGRLREARLTSAARSFDRLGWYVGTAGVGLLYFREGAGIPERLPFGIMGDNLGAVFSAPGGVWTASLETASTPAALNFVASDLSDFRTILGPPATGFRFSQVRRLLGVGTSIWAATERGLARIDPASGRAELLDETRGMPDSRVYSIAARRGWIAAGTAHGVVRVADSAEVIRIAPSFSDAALAVAISADTTWVGTSTGLFFTVGRDGELLRPAALARSPQAREPVLALEWLGETLVALTPDRVIHRRPAGDWVFGPVMSSQIGRLRAIDGDGPGTWLAGERGIGFARLGFPVGRAFLVGDLPADPRDIAADADFVWVATGAGLVRFAREAIGP